MLLRGSVFALAAFSLLIVSINGADGRMGDSKSPEGEQMYSIFVPVNVKLDRLDAFVKASKAVAAATVLEPGCWRYDVLQDMDVPSRFYFYEIFQDRAAAEAHWETEHFKTWWSAVEDMVDGDVKTTTVGSGKQALRQLMTNTYDCMILDLALSDISGFDVLKEMNESEEISAPPVVVYAGRELTPDEELKLQMYSGSIMVKGVKSEERLLDETALFLHRVIDDLPESKKQIIARLHDKDSIFEGKKVLLVDDDMRNVFALSKVMEGVGMEIYKAANGQKALEVLDKYPEIDLILMDIMMPVMDGYEAMRHIREQDRFIDMPILALTAKAMVDDREKCIAAGANDYMPKPVDIDRLLSLIRVWLYK